MSLKKALMTVGTVVLAILTIVFLINTFLPQLAWLTQPIITFLTVDLIHYVQNGITYITTAIALIGATIGEAMRQVNKAKTEVKNVKTMAATQSSEANGAITGLLNEKDTLTKTIATKDEQIAVVNQQLQEATISSQEVTAKIGGLTTENERLKAQLQQMTELKALTDNMKTDPRVIEANTPKVL